MPNNHTASSTETWSSTQAYTLAVVCLLAGVAGGWIFRGSQPASAGAPAAVTSAAAGMAGDAGTPPTPEQMKRMADVSAAPLLEKLKTEPKDPGLLTKLGNIYYDAQQYRQAIDYYQRVLEIQPSDAGVRTDMATAIWYAGDADTAIDEFNKALGYEPTKPNTLFNLGIVKWQGKMDISGAVAVWQKLLETNPDYEAKDKVKDLIAQARKHAGVKPGTQAKPLSQ